MSQQVINLQCPNCAASVSTGQKICIYCQSPIVISSFNSVYNMPVTQLNKYANSYRQALSANPDNQDLNTSIAMCYLKLNLYDKAISAFDKVIENNFDNTETFFYAAVSLLKGKKAFVSTRADIDKIIENLNAAISIEPRGIYYYFLAYIKHDYFERKYLNVSPNWQEILQTATDTGVSEADIDMLFDVLGVEKPECLKV